MAYEILFLLTVNHPKGVHLRSLLENKPIFKIQTIHQIYRVITTYTITILYTAGIKTEGIYLRIIYYHCYTIIPYVFNLGV